MTFPPLQRLIAALLVCAAMFTAPAVLAQTQSVPKTEFELAYRLAQLSNLSYEGDSAIMGEAMARQSKVFVATPGNTDVLYFMGFNDKRKIQAVVVRGSDNETNWDLNRDTRGVTDPRTGIMLHAGFKRAADAIYADLKPRLKPGYTTYLTGHSLGGAVAAIIGAYMQADGVKVGRIVTFGQPKFTNAAGAAAFANLPLLRVINQNDVVPLLPDETLQGTNLFVHIGDVLIVYPGPYYVFGSRDRASRFSAGSFSRYMLQSSVPDHYLRWYEQNLRDKLAGATAVKFADRERYIIRRGPNAGAAKFAPTEKRQNFGGSR